MKTLLRILWVLFWIATLGAVTVNSWDADLVLPGWGLALRNWRRRRRARLTRLV